MEHRSSITILATRIGCTATTISFERRISSPTGTAIRSGFGNTSRQQRQVFTLNETHIFGPALVNEASSRFNRFHSATTPNAQQSPADFGINNGITQAIGLPQISVAGGLNFGGPSTNPSGRGDTTVVIGDSLNYQRGKALLKLGVSFVNSLTTISGRAPEVLTSHGGLLYCGQC